MMYYVFYVMMIVGFLGVSLMSGDWKTKVIGILLTIVNAIIFWR